MLRLIAAAVTLLVSMAVPHPGWTAPARRSSTSPRLGDTLDEGRAPRTDRHQVVVGLELRNRDALEAFLADIQDPTSPRYQHFLTQEEFNALYAPRLEDEAALVEHLRGAGVTVTERASNRLLVSGTGSVAALERAFGVEIHTRRLGTKKHYAALAEPSLPAHIASSVVGIIGLDDLSEMHPHVRTVEPAAAPHAALGSNCCHLSPNDLFTFYRNSAAAPGAGETIVIAGAYAWRDSDVSAFDAQWGLPPLPAGSGQVCTGYRLATGCQFSSQNSIEIALDVEYAHGTAPAARVINYMAASTSLANFTTMYNRIVTDNPGHVVSTSWGLCEAAAPQSTQVTDDNIFANANAIGQSWFAASGDNGSRDCGDSRVTVDNPANSPHVVGVGGTRPTCSVGLTPGSPACGGYGSEVAWSGSGGGVSQVFGRPAFQSGCGVPAGTKRLVPDVALEADTSPGNYVINGGSWYIIGGTSGAAPQWAGLAAELDQRRGGAGLGNPGALLYGLCGTSAFHDVTSGSNGDYSAGVGYDLVTGLGSFDAGNLLAAAGGATTTTTLGTTTTTNASTTTTTTTLGTTTTTNASTTTTTTTTLGTTTSTNASTTTTTTTLGTTTSTNASTTTTTTTLATSTSTKVSTTTTTTTTLGTTTSTGTPVTTSSTTTTTVRRK